MNDSKTSTDHSEKRFNSSGYSFYSDLETETAVVEQGNYVCDLQHLGFIRARGKDSVNYLHGQLTNDLQNLPTNRFQLSGYCTAKGRLINIFQLSHTDNGLLLQANSATLPTSVQHLRKYIMRADVELEIDNEVMSYGVVGKESEFVLNNLLGVLPATPYDCIQQDALSVIRHPSTTLPRYQLTVANGSSNDLLNELGIKIPRVGSWSWASLQIANGIASIHQHTDGIFVPQNVNLDIIGAVNFKKGCYPGQEIVARMHYLGKPKTRMIRGVVAGSGVLLPGDKIYATGGTQSTGSVVDCVPSATGHTLLLTARLQSINDGGLHLGEAEGPLIEPMDLPYSVEL